MNRIVDYPTTGWPFVNSAVAYDIVDSTSNRAAELVREGCCTLPLLVWAREQTQGRGRSTHEWWSDAGSLTLTLAIDPVVHGLTVENEPKLALATAVAVIEALNELELGSPSLGIRWPNDLEADGRKLGGILPENLETPHGRRILIGIGLNVHTNLAAAPAEVRVMATSLAALQAKPLDAFISGRILPVLLVRFESVLHRLAVGEPALACQWDRLDLLREKWVRVDLGTHHVAGWGRGIDHDGALCLDDGQKPLRIFGGRVIRNHSW